jgi:N-acetylglucosaminyldiphosphoundecaprenol N-acetyl-beta-D-mannosaminyltransferase
MNEKASRALRIERDPDNTPTQDQTSARDRPVSEVGGVSFTRVTDQETIRIILDELDAGRGGWLISMNLDGLRVFRKSPEAQQLCSPVSFLVADGMPLIWAAHLQRTPLPGRVAGSSLIFTLTEAAAKRGRSVFLLGGDEGTAAAAGRVLERRFPGSVAGTDCPPIGFEKDLAELGRIRQLLRTTRPDIVYVAMGFPKQERLIRWLRDELPGIWWTGVGISFSFISGKVRRAPPWMQDLGLEWLHRLAQEPRKLFVRYVIKDIPFALWLLGASVLRRFARSEGRSELP